SYVLLVDTAKILQSLYKVPVIFITAYNDKATLNRVCEVDFIGYLIKPYRVDELETLIFFAVSKFELLEAQDTFIKIGEYKYNKIINELFYKNEKINLTKNETKLIQLIINVPCKIISYKTIEETLWIGEVISDDTRRQFLYRFKKKLPHFPIKLEKVWGIG
ncbi:MAG: hypothetical protein U5K55_08715, partial [Aliarcobacter sp.]|nr:hypothetical protein [Aliarcobacter sp.]